MKAGTLAIAAIASLAAAQPHKNAHKHQKRQAVVTEVEYVTAVAPNVMVYVDSNGNPVGTSYANAPAATAAPVAPVAASASAPAAAHNVHIANPAAYPNPPAPVASSSEAAVAAPSVPKVAPTPVAEPVAQALNVAESKTSSAAADSSSSPSSGSSGPGIAYSPYNSDNSCKSASQVKEDLAQLSSYPLIRLYGVDCNQVENVLAGKAAHQKIFAGIFNIGAVDSECDTLISAVGGKWGEIDTVSTGNELLNQHAASAQQLVTAINAAKAKLKPAGYSGPVVYVDTFNAMIAQNKIDSSLCEASDYSAANAHAFFNPTLVASDAGPWVKATAADIAASCPGKKVVITESGYPSAGLNNGLAVPSQANHAAAIESIKTSMATSDAGLILYSAYNDHWKVNAQWNFFAEQSWGIYGDAPSA